jgi:hypothetical protein
MKHWLIAAIIFISLPALAANAAKPAGDTQKSGSQQAPTSAAGKAKPVSDKDQIKSIVETFRTSILNKDKDAFLKLFYSDTIPWLGVTTDKSLKMLHDRKTDVSKPDPLKIYADDTPTKFIEGVVTHPTIRIEEKFSNVRIDTDGNIAQVYFDYAFSAEAYKVNWGKESWQLLHTADGWKISSVIWSMEMNPDLPKAK